MKERNQSTRENTQKLGEIIARNMPDKGLIFLIYKDTLKLIKKKTKKNPIRHELKPTIHRKDTKISLTYNKKNVN